MTAENEGAKIYRAALYLRLSRDESGAYESSSIISQKKLLADYIKEKRDLEIFGVYCDDGYSGVDFDRPDFLRMLADIYEGHVSCVIVKDFSRLGRDYIDTGYYIEKFLSNKAARNPIIPKPIIFTPICYPMTRSRIIPTTNPYTTPAVLP